MEIPDYILVSVYRHYSRLAARAEVDPSDTITMNARRLAGKDLRKLKAYIDKIKPTKKNDTIRQI